MESAKSALAHSDEQVDLLEVVGELWADRKLLVGVTLLFAICSVLFALSLPNVYQASVLLRPQSSEGALGGLARQYGGLASLAGISLPSGSGQSKTQLALEVLKSKKFAYEFALRHDLLPAFFAAEGWDSKLDVVRYNPELYDFSSKQWLSDGEPPRSAAPSAEEFHELWLTRVGVSESSETGFVSLTMRHFSPALSKEWLDWLIKDLNEAIRAQDLAEAERAVLYLEQQLQQTKVAEIRELLAGLLRSHMESRMMATVEPHYVFSVIDPPTVPERKAEPNRPLLCILGTLLGVILSILLSRIRLAYRNRSEGRA